MKKVFIVVSICLMMQSAVAQRKTIDQRVDSVLRLMTLEEKIGQMNQYNSDFAATGPVTKDGDKQEQVRKGMVGSFLNLTGVERTRSLQEIAMRSRLKIPLIFGQDIIHGYRTIFPVPLAEAASWDLAAIELSARVAATEAAAAGVHWTFAPMVDIARDPRWGRVMEGAGEDTYLGSKIAYARVKGFQGNGIGNTNAIIACAKHYAAYGAAVGGRDYNSVDMSLAQLHNIYLPPFKAALDAGAGTFMNSFNDLNGIPATGNKYLLRDVLKKQWKFDGYVVSDWNSIGEMINHGYADDAADAALIASNAGCDMDMESRAYIKNLQELVATGKVKPAIIDEAVRRILKKKFQLGIFDDPFRFCNEEREKQQWDNASNLLAAHDIAKKSIVLLKNDKAILPLNKTTNKKIALIGPFGKAVRDHLGFWSYDWPDDSVRVNTIYTTLQKKLGAANELLYAQGCSIRDSSTAGFDEAIRVASTAEIIIVTVGEARDMSGEAKSRSSIHLPGVQEELVKKLVATGKPVIVLISAGRPLIFNWIADNAKAIVYTWWLGTRGADAIADVLFGDYNPSGKLPISFPRTEGQVPIYYNKFNTGRPARNDSDLNYVSAYIDLPNSPKYPFGFGLSYTTFSYTDVKLDKATFTNTQKITATVTVTNTGNFDGEEVIQLYIRDMVGSIVRPVLELKGFKKLFFKKGETKVVDFTIGIDDLKFYNNELNWIAEPGKFQLFIGSSSEQLLKTEFTLTK